LDLSCSAQEGANALLECPNVPGTFWDSTYIQGADGSG
jgi:hypothetical protein